MKEMVVVVLCYGWKPWGDVLKNGSCKDGSHPGATIMEVMAGSLVHSMVQFVVSPASLQACICMLELMTTVNSDLQRTDTVTWVFLSWKCMFYLSKAVISVCCEDCERTLRYRDHIKLYSFLLSIGISSGSFKLTLGIFFFPIPIIYVFD